MPVAELRLAKERIASCCVGNRKLRLNLLNRQPARKLLAGGCRRYYIYKKTYMKYWLTIVTLAASTYPIYGQPYPIEVQHQQEVVKAELAFAQHAQDHSVRKAFIQYADSQGVVFLGGQVRNAIKSFSAMSEIPVTLLWRPSFSAMAKSGDFGFTTGPFTAQYHAPAKDTNTIEAGQYSTIWLRNKEGQWKFLVDIGIHYPSSLYDKLELKQVSSTRMTPSAAASAITQVMDTNALAPERYFIKKYHAEGIKAYKDITIYETWFNTDGHQPVTNIEDVERSLTHIPDSLQFKPIAAGMSSSRDMAYVYGTVTNKDKKDHYLRVWVHTADGWKLLLQTLRC